MRFEISSRFEAAILWNPLAVRRCERVVCRAPNGARQWNWFVPNFGLQWRARVTALTDVINQNTPGNSQGFPLGVPSSWGWYAGSTQQNAAPPSDFSAVTGWGQIYPEVGQTVNPGSVQIANFQTWVHLTTGGWVEVQDQATSSVAGLHYAADFSGSTVPWNETKNADGSVSVDAPQSAYNDHFWPGTRGTYAPGTVDGVYVQASMKTNDPSEHYVADLGADWWRSAASPFLYQNGVFVNNPAAGSSNWVDLTTSYQTLYYTSLSAAKLQADPPPPLQGTSAPTTPTQPTTPTTPTTPNVAPSVTQASASPGTGTEHVGDTIKLTLGFSEAVTVNGTPTLSLNDGAIATYTGGSGTGTLTFSTTVSATNTNTSALAITKVNLTSGASITDFGGLAANLSGAVKTFSGLQISTSSTTTPTTPATPTTPSTVTKPVLQVADTSLWVSGRGGQVDLGLNVTTTDPNDLVSVRIQGLPRYETITTSDGSTFRGSDITLTAAQVDGGLTLTSWYRGGGHPVADLTLTASAKDPVTGAVTSATPQSITVTDPRPTNWPSHTTAAASIGSLANQGFAQLQQRLGSDTSTLATTAPQTASWSGHDTAGASQAGQTFTLLNQYLAGSSGRVDGGQIAAAISNGATSTQNSFLTRPQH
ncbi:hypothetical protein ABIB82_007351 [Bradyrhizobium sp. i1.8.4]|uniref:hypothetical protein n=1 Tax=unclassified Bradyrhizobium TaxID=2631580 RepID=UPI003D24EF49